MFRRKPAEPTDPPEWMIVGLGNPGPEYRGTRHNVGFELIDRLAERHRIRLDQNKHRARFGVGKIGGTAVALVKPMTFMNLSGQAIAPLMRQFSLKAERVLVVADDVALHTGRLRLKPKGSAGGHNGHKSLITSLGTNEYPRLKIGIGGADGGLVDHVLGAFDPAERVEIAEALSRAERVIEALDARGWEAALNVANEPTP